MREGNTGTVPRGRWTKGERIRRKWRERGRGGRVGHCDVESQPWLAPAVAGPRRGRLPPWPATEHRGHRG
eukprot:9503844-Pyramimonas_sp.AAC.1